MFVESHEFPEVLKRAFPRYRGRKFQINTCEQVTLSNDSWDEGNKSTYVLVELATGIAANAIYEFTNPVTSPTQGRAPTLDLTPGYAVVEHCIFTGKDFGLRAYVHPENIVPMLPAPVPDDMSKEEQEALQIICSIKSQYRAREWKYLELPGTYGMGNPLIQALEQRKLVTINKTGGVAATMRGKNLRRQRVIDSLGW